MTNTAVQLVALLALSSLVWWLTQRRRGQFRPTGAIEGTVTVRGSTVLGTGHDLAERATFVQFSAETCSTCPRVRRVLTQIASSTAGVGYVELAAHEHMDLVRRLSVLRTPTVLLLAPDGAIHSRTSGPVTPEQAAAALRSLDLTRPPVTASEPGARPHSVPTPWSRDV